MPSLHWIGKEKVINHHHDVPFKVLNKHYTFNADDEDHYNESKIIHGDNLEALKALLPEYEGKVKCIYIDPPYNTGKDAWKYNDRVEHPTIKKWLDCVVGKEGEDLSRHDKWLCMMYPRIKLLQKLLSDDGVIFISIDDNEVFNLKLILNEIFGLNNFVGNIIWETATDNNPRQISVEHEYVLCYAKNKTLQKEWFTKSQAASTIQSKYDDLKSEYLSNTSKIQTELRKWIKSNKSKLKLVEHYDNVDQKGVFHDDNIANTKFGGYAYEILHPITGKPCKIPEKGYRYPEQSMKALIANDDIMFGADETTLVKPKRRLENVKDRLRSVVYEDGRASTKDLESMFQKEIFKNPKSETVVRRLISFCTDSNSIILDSFAGSGTTAHAVLNLNKQDGGNRKFILIEMEEYAESITAERVKRVINGYASKAGTGGSFSYYSLGEPLFTGENNEYLNEAVGIDKIRNYVWYSETRSPLLNDIHLDHHFLGKRQGTAYYLLYHAKEFTSLDYQTLETINIQADQYIIYADNCLLSKEFLLHHHIIFKKTPRDISRF